MLKNHFLSALRNIKKNLLLSVINIGGLSIGIAIVLMAMLFINDEFKYDSFHKNASSVYRIAMFNGEQFHNPLTPMPLAPLLEQNFPQIKKAVRIYKNRSNAQLISYGDKKFFENGCIYADSSFFDVFSFPLIKGNMNTALSGPGNVVLTESSAHKYFADEDPIGKKLIVDNGSPAMVTGVIKDIPEHSHIHFDFLFSFESMSQNHKDNWLIPFMFTYVLIPDKEAAKTTAPALTDFAAKHMNPQIKEALGISFDELLKKNNQSYRLYLQPLTSIHLHSNLKVELEPNSSIMLIYIFAGTGLLVLVLACINFINLTTAISNTRQKEIAVRKVNGASRGQLITQFLTESLVYGLLAAALAIVLATAALPAINHLLGKHLDIFKPGGFTWIIETVVIAVVTSVVSGLYPAFYLSKQHPVKSFRKFAGQRNSFSVRKILVTAQYVISSALIVSVCVVYQQLHYMENRDMGFNKEQLVVIPIEGNMGLSEKLVLKNELLQNAAIGNVSLANYVPGQEAYENQDVFLPEGGNSKEPVPLWYINSDFDFLNTMQLKLISGRNFSRSLSTDSTAYLINETAAKLLGWNLKAAIGKRIYSFDDPDKKKEKRIIGVVKDFQFENFSTPVRPMIVGINTHFWWKYIVRINARDARSTIDFIKAKWKIFQPAYPFEYSFVDQSFDSFVRKEKVISRFSVALTAVAIIIASLGLLALSLFITLQRRKEIGIRKIAGATVIQIVVLLSQDILKLILLAFCIAAPIAWFAMNQWLQDFSYRVHINWWIFVFAAMLSITLGLLTIIFQSIKSALANPVKNLKIE